MNHFKIICRSLINLQASNKQLTTPEGELKYLGYVCTNLKYKNLSFEHKMYIRIMPGLFQQQFSKKKSKHIGTIIILCYSNSLSKQVLFIELNNYEVEPDTD